MIILMYQPIRFWTHLRTIHLFDRVKHFSSSLQGQQCNFGCLLTSTMHVTGWEKPYTFIRKMHEKISESCSYAVKTAQAKTQN